MLKKSEACAGCPMFQDGRGFVPDEVVEGATTFVLGQNPGSDEEREGRPFVGKSGQLLVRSYFPIANLTRGENVSIGNALRCRLLVNGRRTNDLPREPVLGQALAHCTAAHLRVPASTTLIVALGEVAVRAVTGKQVSVLEWRGYLVS